MDQRILSKARFCRPPSRFNAAGEVLWAQFAPVPPFSTAAKVTGKRRAGILYEAKAQDYISVLVTNVDPEKLRLTYLRSPWVTFKTSAAADTYRHCQPDGVLVDLSRKHVTMIEIKLQHTSDAWWQLRELYEPVLRHIYNDFTFSALEVVRWLDPHTTFPEIFHFEANVLETRPNSFGVHIYYPPRKRK